jgi:RHS repeat-associated protein
LPPLHRDHNVAALVRVTPDHQGSIREMTDSSGNIVYQQTYDPYGNPAHLQGSGSQPDFGYQGYYFHQRSGLNLTARRAYSPKFGRFLNRDPVKEKGGSNLFAYVDNDPINSTDPSGLQGVWWQPTPLLPGPGTLTDPIVSGPNPLNPAPYFRPPNQAPNEWDPYWDPNDPKDRPQYNRCIEDAYANAKKLPPGHCREKFLEDEIQKCKEKWLNKKWRNKSHPGWGWDPETNAPFEIPVDA